MSAAAAITITLLAWAAGAWLGLWLNRRLKLGPWAGPRWATQLMYWSVRYIVFHTGFMMVSVPLTYLAFAVLW